MSFCNVLLGIHSMDLKWQMDPILLSPSKSKLCKSTTWRARNLSLSIKEVGITPWLCALFFVPSLLCGSEYIEQTCQRMVTFPWFGMPHNLLSRTTSNPSLNNWNQGSTPQLPGNGQSSQRRPSIKVHARKAVWVRRFVWESAVAGCLQVHTLILWDLRVSSWLWDNNTQDGLFPILLGCGFGVLTLTNIRINGLTTRRMLEEPSLAEREGERQSRRYEEREYHSAQAHRCWWVKSLHTSQLTNHSLTVGNPSFEVVHLLSLRLTKLTIGRLAKESHHPPSFDAISIQWPQDPPNEWLLELLQLHNVSAKTVTLAIQRWGFDGYRGGRWSTGCSQ